MKSWKVATRKLHTKYKLKKLVLHMPWYMENKCFSLCDIFINNWDDFNKGLGLVAIQPLKGSNHQFLVHEKSSISFVEK